MGQRRRGEDGQAAKVSEEGQNHGADEGEEMHAAYFRAVTGAGR